MVKFKFEDRSPPGSAHIHLTLFSREEGQTTWANCGTLVLRKYEAVDFIEQLNLTRIGA